MPILTAGPSRLLGGGGVAAPTPILGAELVVNGDFASDTVWSKGTGWTITGGIANADGSNGSPSYLAQSGIASVTGGWYLGQYTATRSAGAYRMSIGGNDTGFYNVGATRYYVSPRVSNSNLIITADSGPSFVGTVDNVSLKLITFASMFNLRNYGTHRIAKAGWNIVRDTRAGVAACADASLQNVVFASHDGVTARLAKLVGGTRTELISVTKTYVAGANVEIRRLVGTDTFQLWYNNAQVGTDQTISDAGIVNNTLWGAFNSFAGNVMAGPFSCIAST